MGAGVEIRQCVKEVGMYGNNYYNNIKTVGRYNLYILASVNSVVQI